jgi:glucosamine-phosphate N-acetyltransferase
MHDRIDFKGHNLIVRNLQCSDYFKGIFSLLSQLTNKTITISQRKFMNYLDNLNNNYQIIVVEDTSKDTIIGTITFFIEYKIIHNCGIVMHIEDLVISNSSRNIGLGKYLINRCSNIAKELECYKIILNCNDANVPFYEKCGFEKKENEMVFYII